MSKGEQHPEELAGDCCKRTRGNGDERHASQDRFETTWPSPSFAEIPLQPSRNLVISGHSWPKILGIAKTLLIRKRVTWHSVVLHRQRCNRLKSGGCRRTCHVHPAPRQTRLLQPFQDQFNENEHLPNRIATNWRMLLAWSCHRGAVKLTH